jgi:hypothetical protein
MLHVKRESGSDLLLDFPHSEISNIVENAAMQWGNRKDPSGRKTNTAFNTKSFQIGRGEHPRLSQPHVRQAGCTHAGFPRNR